MDLITVGHLVLFSSSSSDTQNISSETIRLKVPSGEVTRGTVWRWFKFVQSGFGSLESPSITGETFLVIRRRWRENKEIQRREF